MGMRKLGAQTIITDQKARIYAPHNCLSQIVGYNFYRDGKVTNEEIRAEALSAYAMETNLELRRCRWLEKVANMGEKTDCLENYLEPSAMENLDDAAKPKLVTIRHGYCDTLESRETTGRLRSDLARANDLSEWRCQLPEIQFYGLK